MNQQQAYERILLKGEENDIPYNEIAYSYDLRVRLSLYTEDELTDDVVDDIFAELFL